MAHAEENHPETTKEDGKSLGRKIKLKNPPLSEEYRISNKYYNLDVQIYLDNVSHLQR